jgi:hypothetical protein
MKVTFSTKYFNINCIQEDGSTRKLLTIAQPPGCIRSGRGVKNAEERYRL